MSLKVVTLLAIIVSITCASLLKIQPKFGKCLNNRTLTTFHAISVQACVRECIYRPMCMSVNYRARFHRCELNNARATTLPLYPCLGYCYIGVRNETSLLLDHPSICANSTCPETTRCENISGSATCETRECTSTTAVANGVVLGNLNTVGAYRRVVCLGNHVCRGSPRMLCQASGNWTQECTCELGCSQPVVPNNYIAKHAEIYTTTEHVILTFTNISGISILSEFLAPSSVQLDCSDQNNPGTFTSSCDNGVWSSVPACESNSSPLGNECSSQDDCHVSDSDCRNGRCQCETTYSYIYSRNECDPGCDEYANTFQEELGMKLAFNDIVTISTTSLQECMDACLAADTFVCASFEISVSRGICHLQDVTANEGEFDTSESYDYYQRDCLS